MIAACVEPHCYQDEEWMEDVRSYSNRGYEIKMVTSGEGRIKLESCKCVDKETLLELQEATP
jgi:hypothetical protein